MKKYFITGLLIWIPLAITGMVLAWIVGTLDQVMLWMPQQIQPQTVLGFNIPGLGAIVTLLIEYPRESSWTIAFLTGKPGGAAADHLPGNYVSVYVPTTPNPTSGFFLMLPAADVIELDMSVDEALKYIISMGVVAPSNQRSAAKPALLNQ